MARTPSPRYFNSRKAYYVQYQGRQHCLAAGPRDEPDGPTYLRAVKRFAELMHCAQADQAQDGNLVITILDRYAVHLRNKGRTGSYNIFKDRLATAILEFGQIPIRDLKAMHVTAWLDKMQQGRVVKVGRKGRQYERFCRWGPTSRRMAAQALLTSLNWAVKQGMITKNPLTKEALDLDRVVGRSQDYVVRPGEHEALVTLAKSYFGELLAVLAATGCRPGELYHATAANYDESLQALVYKARPEDDMYVHKTARKTGKDRVIYLPEPEAVVVARLVTKYPRGPLFRSGSGKRWNDQAVYEHLKRLRRRLKLTGKMIPYSYRHTYATHWLLSGRSIKVLADLLGNSVAMLEKHYSHLEVDPAVMRKLACDFAGERQKEVAPSDSARGQ
jgi:integrase